MYMGICTRIGAGQNLLIDNLFSPDVIIDSIKKYFNFFGLYVR
jgi:hypothetical protein